jgi:hypothetical protein
VQKGLDCEFEERIGVLVEVADAGLGQSFDYELDLLS